MDIDGENVWAWRITRSLAAAWLQMELSMVAHWTLAVMTLMEMSEKLLLRGDVACESCCHWGPHFDTTTVANTILLVVVTLVEMPTNKWSKWDIAQIWTTAQTHTLVCQRSCTPCWFLWPEQWWQNDWSGCISVIPAATLCCISTHPRFCIGQRFLWDPCRCQQRSGQSQLGARSAFLTFGAAFWSVDGCPFDSGACYLNGDTNDTNKQIVKVDTLIDSNSCFLACQRLYTWCFLMPKALNFKEWC